MTGAMRIRPGTRIAVMLGAGASFGSGARIVPPLGSDLFGCLASRYRTWGDPTLEPLFEQGFESGLSQLWMNGDLRLTPLSHDFMHFFSKFNPTEETLYSKAVTLLAEGGHIPSTILASMNYECFLEYACEAVTGIEVTERNYTLRRLPFGCPRLIKLHGSANLVVPSFYGIRLQSEGHTIQGMPTIPVTGDHFDVVPLFELQNAYEPPDERIPFFSHYAPDKPPAAMPQALQQFRYEWESWAAGADAVFVIGCNTNSGDPHVWRPIHESKGRVFYAGRDPGGICSHNGFQSMGETFGEAIEFMKPLLTT